VVHQHEIGADRSGHVDGRLAGVYSRRNSAHTPAAFKLEAIHCPWVVRHL
jgi:hypothetical protein